MWANRNEGHPSYDHDLKHRALKPSNDWYWRSMSILHNHINPLESCTKPYFKCSVIISKKNRRRSHQAQLFITSQPSSWKINLYSHGNSLKSCVKISTWILIKQSNHFLIISPPSSYRTHLKLNPLKLHLDE